MLKAVYGWSCCVVIGYGQCCCVIHNTIQYTMCMVVCSKVGVKVTRQMASTSGHAMSFSDTDLTPSRIVLENKT